MTQKPLLSNPLLPSEFNSRHAMYAAIGQGITAWANMEAALIMIASMLLKTTTRKTSIVFYSIINFNVWLSIIAELFPESENHRKLKSKWNLLAKRLRDLNNTRVGLAHYPVYSGVDGAVLKPHEYNQTLKALGHKPLTAMQIMTWVQNVVDISNELTEFVRSLETLYKQPKKSP